MVGIESQPSVRVAEAAGAVGPAYVSTGDLPPTGRAESLVSEAYERFKSNEEGANSDVYPALEAVPPDLFGICLVGTNGAVYTAGEVDHEFAIMSVSKLFVFAMVCQALGAEEVRRKIGVNATGLAFNSVMAIELHADRTVNPMVNAGAIATTSLAPGADT